MSHDRFDDALARTLTDTASTAEPCPDAAALAAFSEHELSTSEHATVQGHVASCLRCQAHLAALARTADVEPAAGVEPRRWTWWLDWRWVTPLAATAVVVLSVWVIDPASQRQGFAGPEPEADLGDELMERSSRTVAPTPAEPLDCPARAAAATSPAISTNAAPTAETRREVRVPSAPAPRLRVDAMREQEAMVPVVEEALGAVALESRAMLADVADAADLLIASATAGTMWRIVTTRVERSTDGGASWTEQPLPTTSVLLAGSSPADRVCWIVGEAGTIVRTGDAGETWTRVVPPQPETYTDVDARSVDAATVTSADGTRFTTVDGGVTWTMGAADAR